jgi:hypothetical protein
MRTRLREVPDMDATYPHLHDHRLYGAGHDIRARVTIGLGQWALIDCAGMQVADLSAGAGIIAKGIDQKAILGDYAPGHPIHGPIEDTITQLPDVDLLVCTETLEHLHDPDWVLRAARTRARRLLCSLPECPEYDTNGEHVWQFDRVGGEEMLTAAGWEPTVHVQIDPPDGPYRYHLWVCR